MSQDIGMAPNPRAGFGVLWLAGWPAWPSGGLVAAGGVELQVPQELAGGGVDDADVAVAGLEQDVGLGVGAADADVVELAGVAQGDGAVGVDAVGADPVMGV